MFLDKKTLLKISVNHGLNLTIFRGTGPCTLSNIVLDQFSYYKMLFSFLFSSFPDQAYNWTNVPVYVMRRGALTVEFCSSRDRDEDNLLCEMEVTVPPQQRDPDVSVVIQFTVPIKCYFLLIIFVWKRRVINIYLLLSYYYCLKRWRLVHLPIILSA